MNVNSRDCDYYVNMNGAHKKIMWLLVLIVSLIPLSGYWPSFDRYGQPIHQRKCKAYSRVIVFADSKGFTDKRHVSVDVCGNE